MIIDCHYHLDPKLKTVDELLSEMDASGVDRVALMGKQIQPMPDPSRVVVATMQFCLRHGPLRRLIKPLVANFTEDGAIKVPGGVHPIDPDPPNQLIFDAVREHPDRFLGWVFVNPHGELDPVEELERWAGSPGFVGVKAHPFWNRHSPRELAPVAERLVKLGKPMLIHCGFDEDGDFGSLTFPRRSWPSRASSSGPRRSRRAVSPAMAGTSRKRARSACAMSSLRRHRIFARQGNRATRRGDLDRLARDSRAAPASGLPGRWEPGAAGAQVAASAPTIASMVGTRIGSRR